MLNVTKYEKLYEKNLYTGNLGILKGICIKPKLHNYNMHFPNEYTNV